MKQKAELTNVTGVTQDLAGTTLEVGISTVLDNLPSLEL